MAFGFRLFTEDTYLCTKTKTFNNKVIDSSLTHSTLVKKTIFILGITFNMIQEKNEVWYD